MGTLQGNRFTNWGATVSATVRHVHYPKTTADVVTAVQQTRQRNGCLRVVGTGHSWTPLVETPDALLSLDAYQGVLHTNTAALQARVAAGTKLYALGDVLKANGMALENQGDIDRQSVGGILGTGTHGTGIQFGIIATQVVALELVTGTGEVLELTAADGDRFKAALVSLGSLGIITQLTLQCVPAYNLHQVKEREGLAEALAKQEQYRNQNRNYELYFFPYANKVLNIKLNATSRPPDRRGLRKYLVDVVWENYSFKFISELVRLFPSLAKTVNHIGANGMAEADEVYASYQVYANQRLVKFAEMEYGVPAEKGPEVLLRIRDFVQKEKIRVAFPIEYRYVKADDLLLSPAQGRDTCFISLHMYKGMPWEAYFRGAERIFQEYGGRPHWGKMHSLEAPALKPLYAGWDRFLEIRQELDPDGVFLNPYLKRLLGV